MSTKLEYKSRTVEVTHNGDRYVITVNGKFRDVSSGAEAEAVLKSMQLIDAEDAKLDSFARRNLIVSFSRTTPVLDESPRSHPNR
jgi:hypothetical protein